MKPREAKANQAVQGGMVHAWRPSGGCGRPRTQPEIAELIVRMARENPSWGYTRLRGALYNLGHEVGRNTVKSILLENGLEPAPERGVAPVGTRSSSRILGQSKEPTSSRWRFCAASGLFGVPRANPVPDPRPRPALHSNLPGDAQGGWRQNRPPARTDWGPAQLLLPGGGLSCRRSVFRTLRGSRKDRNSFHLERSGQFSCWSL